MIPFSSKPDKHYSSVMGNFGELYELSSQVLALTAVLKNTIQIDFCYQVLY